MPYKISGELIDEEARIIVIDEGAWSIESNTQESQGAYEIEIPTGGTKTIIGRTPGGKSVGYAGVTPIQTDLYAYSKTYYPPDSPSGNPRFGNSIACSNSSDRWLIGCDDFNDYRGAVWYYYGDTLRDTVYYPTTHSRFGNGIDLRAEYASIGAYWAGDGAPGKAYIYKLTTGASYEMVQLEELSQISNDFFGIKTAAGGFTVAIADSYNQSPRYVHIYDMTGGEYGWTKRASIPFSVSGSAGPKLDMYNGSMFIYAFQTQFWIYNGGGSSWTQRKNVDLGSNIVEVDLEDNKAFISADNKVYFYKTTDGGNTWSLEQEITSDVSGFASRKMDFEYDTLVVGANDSEAVVFREEDGLYVQKQILSPNDGTASGFGQSVGVNYNREKIRISAHTADNPSIDCQGRVYQFDAL